MKVIAFNGSARKDGNTSVLIKYVFEELEKEGIDTELIQLAGTNIHGCRACMGCFKNKDNKCVIKDDDVNNYIEKMIEADPPTSLRPSSRASPSEARASRRISF